MQTETNNHLLGQYEKSQYWDLRNETKEECSTFADLERRLATEYVHVYLTPQDANPYKLNEETRKLLQNNI